MHFRSRLFRINIEVLVALPLALVTSGRRLHIVSAHALSPTEETGE